MKTSFALLASCIVGITALTFIYRHSAGGLGPRYQETLGLLSAAKQVDTSLDANVLRSRDFLLLNYDAIVDNENKLRASCRSFQKLVPPMRSLAFDRATEKYCAAVEAKLTAVETFKSRASVLRNSLYYLRGVGSVDRKQSAKSSIDRDLIAASLSYYLIPNEEDRDFLSLRLHTVSRKSILLAKHVEKILAGKDEVDGLVKTILHSEISIRAEELRESLTSANWDSERNATRFRQLLFWSALLLLAITFYGMHRIIGDAHELAKANERLEVGVEERTRELKEAQWTVVQQQQSLAASTKLSSLGEMAGGIAHEINNPLAIINTVASQLVEVLSEDSANIKLAASMASQIVRTAERIARIVQGLRIFSRDGSGDPFANVAVRSLINDTLAFCQERYRSHGVALTVEAFPENLTFEGRSTQISQVLLNLLNNSFDATSSLSERWVKINVSEAEAHLEVRVTDSGSGLSETARMKLFQPFFTTKEVGKGTGLGLSISHGIIRDHHGTLTLDTNTPNTCFVIRLPLKQVRQHPERAA